MMYWFILFILVLMVSLGWIVWLRIREQKYLRKSVREALGPDLRKEIEEEREVFARRKARFEKALERAQRKR